MRKAKFIFLAAMFALQAMGRGPKPNSAAALKEKGLRDPDKRVRDAAAKWEIGPPITNR